MKKDKIEMNIVIIDINIMRELIVPQTIVFFKLNI